ncbi:hypothetical protein SRRS_06950 [Sporomusa rhizae]|uniref:hypothetical protein n=1 Tax=Sporomusa rhizae TaxID=357999 RepID=UPI00352A5541
MKAIPAEYIPIINPDKLAFTLNQLDVALENVVKTGETRESAYQNKAELVRQKTQCETDIKLAEADAFMNTQGEGKEQHGLVDGKKIMLNNDANRDAYRRSYSAKERRELGNVNAQLNSLDVDYYRANDAWAAAVEASNIIKSKAGLQAALLNFLAGKE